MVLLIGEVVLVQLLLDLLLDFLVVKVVEEDLEIQGNQDFKGLQLSRVLGEKPSFPEKALLFLFEFLPQIFEASLGSAGVVFSVEVECMLGRVKNQDGDVGEREEVHEVLQFRAENQVFDFDQEVQDVAEG